MNVSVSSWENATYALHISKLSINRNALQSYLFSSLFFFLFLSLYLSMGVSVVGFFSLYLSLD